MGIRMKVAACLIWCSIAVAASALPGCGPDDGLGKRVPVSGSVSYKGQPLASGNISFTPEDPTIGRPASGSIEGGSYRMTTLSPDDGVIPGKYRVTISALEGDELKRAGAAGAGGMVDQVVVAKAYQKAKSTIPLKYNDLAKSGLTIEVPGGNYDFDLKE